MQSLIDFLTFKLLISPSVLLIIYYAGALFIPVVNWWLLKKLQTKYFSISDVVNTAKEEVRQLIPLKTRVLLFNIGLVTFVLMEVFWRMMLEFLIVYFQMRSALVIY